MFYFLIYYLSNIDGYTCLFLAILYLDLYYYLYILILEENIKCLCWLLISYCKHYEIKQSFM